MRRYRVLVALALASFLVVVQTGTAFASMIQAVEGSAAVGCPECPDCPPMEADAMQCLAHCASHTAMAAGTVSPLVVPPASSERVRTRQPMRKPMSPVPPPVAHSHPPPIRILYQSFQI